MSSSSSITPQATALVVGYGYRNFNLVEPLFIECAAKFSHSRSREGRPPPHHRSRKKLRGGRSPCFFAPPHFPIPSAGDLLIPTPPPKTSRTAGTPFSLVRAPPPLRGPKFALLHVQLACAASSRAAAAGPHHHHQRALASPRILTRSSSCRSAY